VPVRGGGVFYGGGGPQSWRPPDERYYYRILNIDLAKGEVVIENLEKKDVVFALREAEAGGDDAPVWSGGHASP